MADSSAYERKRYARDKKKRIAAERAYVEKQKGKPEYQARVKARNKVTHDVEAGRSKRPSKSAKCPHCGKTGGQKEWHHQTKNPSWWCSKCHPRGGAA